MTAHCGMSVSVRRWWVVNDRYFEGNCEVEALKSSRDSRGFARRLTRRRADDHDHILWLSPAHVGVISGLRNFRFNSLFGPAIVP